MKINLKAIAVILGITLATTSAFISSTEELYVETSEGVFELYDDVSHLGFCDDASELSSCKYTLDDSNPTEPEYIPTEDEQIWVPNP